jgi:hypothetical protein
VYVSVCLFCTILRPHKVTPWIPDWVHQRVTPVSLLLYSPSTSVLYHVAQMMCCWWRSSCNYHCQYPCEQNSLRVREMYCAVLITSYLNSSTLHKAVVSTVQSLVGSGCHGQAVLHLFQKHLHITCYFPSCWPSNYLFTSYFNGGLFSCCNCYGALSITITDAGGKFGITTSDIHFWKFVELISLC